MVPGPAEKAADLGRLGTARPMRRRRAALAAGLAAAALAATRPALDLVNDRIEQRFNRVHQSPPYRVSEAAIELHRTLFVADLHADSLLWGRDLVRRSTRSHVDVPRLIDGGVALQAFAATTHVPWGINVERNEEGSDQVVFLALAQRWPPATWRSRLARAVHLANRARRMADASDARLTLIETRAELATYIERRSGAPGGGVTAALLTIEGAHALDGDPDNLDVLVSAGYRMLGLAHFIDNTFAGSAHGVAKGGLTDLGQELIARAEAASILIDLAHSSAATIDSVLAMASQPVVVSHTGVRAVCESARNLTDDQLRGVAATGGVVGIGFWPTACCGDDAEAIVRSIRHAVDVIGADHVALGSDFDGAVPVPFDVTGMPLLTEALMRDGFAPDAIARIMGGNVLRLLSETLP
jgi:microsomal dipeptidase-like Zn-dependent dipeptidase